MNLGTQVDVSRFEFNDRVILASMDHSMLKDPTPEKLLNYANDVINYNLRGTCFRAEDVNVAKEVFGGANYKNSSVLIFPKTVNLKHIRDMIRNRREVYDLNGNNTLEVARLNLAEKAIKDGATDLDMIINLAAAAQGDYQTVENDVRTFVDSVGNDALVKAIICSPYFTPEGQSELTKAVAAGGAKVVKTTTGFGARAALLVDVYVIADTLKRIGAPDYVGCKAAGGISNFNQAASFYAAFKFERPNSPFIIGESSYKIHENPLTGQGLITGSY